MDRSIAFYRDVLGLIFQGELIQFLPSRAPAGEADLFRPSISEICFYTDDIWAEYHRLMQLGVPRLSEPQTFDFTADGFGKSLALYFRDPDGIILELMQSLAS